MTTTVLIPAHNEEKKLPAALAGVYAQTAPAQRVVVLADNCTDRTADIARQSGAEVFETRDNHAKKAGALNQWFSSSSFDALGPEDHVLVMDADSVLYPEFLSGAYKWRAKGYDAIGGVFLGSPGGGAAGMFQRNEYARYKRDVTRKRGKTLVLTGTATLLPVSVIRAVKKARAEGLIPDKEGKMPKKMSSEERELNFWSRTDRHTNCWLWTGSTNRDGHGTTSVPVRPGRNTTVLTHRQAWEYAFGNIPGGLQVRHSCDEPLCINPEHLLLGTHLDSMQDKVDRDRQHHPAGELNGRAKLTWDDVKSMREEYTGKRGQKSSFARRYDISKTHVGHILNGDVWTTEPGKEGGHSVNSSIYSTGNLTEDLGNELTFALLHLGYRIVAPPECGLDTEVMESWGALWKQRYRWKRGAIETNAQYGLNRITAKYWGMQAWGLAGILATVTYLSVLVLSLTIIGSVHVQALWLAVTVVYVTERTVTVRARGIKQQALASTLVAEMPYDLFLQACHAWSLITAVTRTRKTW